MVRLLEKLWILALVSLAIHLAGVAVMQLLVPPPKYVAMGDSPPDARAPAIVPAPQEKPRPIEREEQTQFGETSGEGESISSLDLPDRSRSPDPQEFEQAWTSRQPVVAPRTQEPQQSPSKSTALVPSGLQTDLPAMSRQTIGKGESSVETPKSDQPVDKQASAGQATDGTEGDKEKNNEATAATPAVEDPAAKGQSDLDPFAEAEGVSLVGGTRARKGREIKFSRPRVDLAFRSAFTRLAERRMIVAFRIRTDAQGFPRDVAVLKSSGSTDIDESLKLAIYDSWFGGKMPDEFPFVIRFYE